MQTSAVTHRSAEARHGCAPAVWVRVGLAHFWAQSMPGQAGWPGLLHERAAGLNGGPPGDWPALRERIEADWPPGPEHFAGARRFTRLVREQALSVPEAFLLALLGEVEVDHTVTLALAELQGAEGGARAGIHLVVAILETLFGAGAPGPLSLAHGGLSQRGVLIVDGDGPLPLRSVRMEPVLWAVIRGQTVLWPGCAVLPKVGQDRLPRALRARLPQLATLLGDGAVRTLVVRGHAGSGRRGCAVALAELLGRQAITVPLEVWRRCPAFAVACHHAGWLPVIQADLAVGETLDLGEGVDDQAVIVAIGSSGAVAGRDTLEIEVGVPDEDERRALWRHGLGDPALAESMAGRARLSAGVIDGVAGSARLMASHAGEPLTEVHVAAARLDVGAEALRLLAQPVGHRVGREAVVFSPLVDRHLADLVSRAKRRESIWQGLGPTLQATQGTGLRALFVGDSGTGKSLAASFFASELGAPLYRVDLSSVMNKYIGESEKNLALLLDRAIAVDAVLLFDEADSLFGRRNDARHSGERYANMLTNYLLTAIEQHPGIVILTTNSRERIDPAFTRRLDAIIEFPLPGFAERLALWQVHLGARCPDPAVCHMLASYCDFSGGQIRNAVLSAAGSATRGDAPLTEESLVRAIRREYQKLGRALPPQLDAREK